MELSPRKRGQYQPKGACLNTRRRIRALRVPGADPGLLSITTKKGCQQGIRKVLGFQVGGNSLKPLEDMNSIQHHMTVPTVRVGQGWTEAPTSGGSLPMF